MVRHIPTVLSLCLAVTLPALASGPDTDARVALALAMAQKKPVQPVPTYAEVLAHAREWGRDLIVWVNCPKMPAGPTVAQFVHHEATSFEGDATPRIIVSCYRDGHLYRRGPALPPTAVPQDIADRAAWIKAGFRPAAAPAAQPSFTPQFRGGSSRSC